MKKIFLIGAFLGIFILPFLINIQPAKAATIEELKAQIAKIQTQLADLQAQLAAQLSTTTTWCHTFNTNLGIGSSGSEVDALESALIKEGILDSAILGTAFNIGFTEETASYIVEFQEKYASEILTPVKLKHGNGYVGKLTRAKLNKLYGCGVNAECTKDSDCPQVACATTATTSNVAPSCIGGPIYKCVSGKCVAENPPTCSSSQWLCSYTNKCIEKNESCCNGLMGGCTDYYGCNPTAGYSWCAVKQKCIRPWEEKCESTTAKSITLTYPTGGESWIAGETYNIIWNASNIEKINISIQSYSSSTVGVGVASLFPYPSDNIIASNVSAYLGKYAYTVPFDITGRGVQIVISEVNGSISGKSGEFKIASGLDCSQKCKSQGYPSGSCQSFAVSPDGFTLQETYAKTHTSIGSTYDCYLSKYIVGSSKSCYCDSPTTKSITVTSPNGGEQWQVGSKHNITWKVEGINKVDLYLKNYDSDVDCLIACAYSTTSSCCAPCNAQLITAEVSAYIGSYSWTVPSSQNISSKSKILIQSSQGERCASDYSDNYFSIVAATTPYIATISPTSGNIGDKVELVIAGSNFKDIYSSVCGVEPSTTQGTEYNGCSIVSSEKIVYKFTILNNATSGTRYINIKSNNGTSNSVPFVVNSPAKSLTVTSPNGGENWQAGKTYDIKWNSTGIDKINIYLTGSKLLNGGVERVECMMVAGAKCSGPCANQTIAQNIDASLGKYSWTIASTQSLYSDAKIIIQEAVSDFMTESCISDSSDSYFSIVVAGTNFPPVVDGLDAPTQLSVNQAGTWTIKAHDPENGRLNYQVKWGDEVSWAGAFEQKALGASITTQTTTFTHTYNTAGTYTITFSVTDDSGQITKTTTTIKVVSGVTCTDSDGGLNYYVTGTTKGINYQSLQYQTVTDTCDAYSNIVEGYCMSDGKLATYGTNCVNGCQDGACYYQKISGIEGNKSSYNPEEKINFTIKGIEIDGSPAASDEGWHVQYYTYNVNDPYNRLEEYILSGNYNGNYSNGYWYVNYSAPQKTGSYFTEITLYCSKENTKCWNLGGHNIHEYKSKVYYSVTISNPSITVTSPNGGEQWQVGQTYNIIWNSQGLLQSDKIYIWLDNYADPTTTGISIIATNLAGNLNSYQWFISSNMDIGAKYKIRIGVCNSTLCTNSEESDNYFSIVAPPIATCTDSDGVNYNIKGSITETNQYTDWKPHIASDICTSDAFFGNSTGNLAEATCTTSNTGQYIFYTCPYGCKDGACIQIAVQQNTLKNMENQLASLSAAANQLMEKVKQLLGQ